MPLSNDASKDRGIVSNHAKDDRLTRFALLLLVVASPSLASAAPVAEQRKDDGVRTGGVGVGTRPTSEVARPGTDMTTAGSDAVEAKPRTLGSADV